ncbi:MAG: D-amino-acid oxidase [Verrucomicrobiota bacterium]
MVGAMKGRVAVVGAGVSGLTCAIVFAEQGYTTSILAEQTGDRTDSAAAAAIWYPYDVEPAEAVMPWALIAYQRFLELARDPRTGVSVVELRTFSRLGPITPPKWALSFDPRLLAGHEIPAAFVSGFSMRVPLIETTKYLEYLKTRAANAGASLIAGIHLENLEEVEARFDLVVNCAGIGAKELVPDPAMEPHRGQVAIVAPLDFSYAVVCDDPPLMYAIPRSQDCVLGGTNDVSDNRAADSTATARIVAECQRVLGFARPTVLAERVGLRPGRKGGVRVAAEKMGDGRRVIHNYGHGGAGFTLSWGCAETVLELAQAVDLPSGSL